MGMRGGIVSSKVISKGSIVKRNRFVAVMASAILSTILLSGCTAVVDLGTSAQQAQQGAEQISQTKDLALATELDNTAKLLELSFAAEGQYADNLGNNGVTVLLDANAQSFVIYKVYDGESRTAYRSSINPTVVYLDEPAASSAQLADAGLAVPDGIAW